MKRSRGDFTSRTAKVFLLSTVVVCISTASAFVVPLLTQRHLVTHPTRIVSTELHGVRAAIRERFRRYRDSRSGRDESTEHLQAESATVLPPLITKRIRDETIKHNEHLDYEELNHEPPAAVVAVLEETRVNGDDECEVDVSRIVLPERNLNDMTQYEKEFRTMMQEVESYTDKCVQSVADPKTRAIFAGARAGAQSPEVYRAFEILFQDLVPVRIAGRMIFRKLSQVMIDSRKNHRHLVDTVANETGMSASDVESGRFAFLSVADYKNDGDTVLNLDQLVETGVAATVVEMLGYRDFDDFIKNTCEDRRCELKFDETMVALQHCSTRSCETDPNCECNPHLVLQEIAKRMNSTKVSPESNRKDKYSTRYDEMVSSFGEWEQYMPEGDGRWLEVLRGCFVGAKNAPVVKALKIVYCDYSALRLAGDTIYGVMAKLIKKKKKARDKG